MEAVIVNEKYKVDWNSYVNGNSLSIAWQVYEWSNLVWDNYGAKLLPLMVMEDNEVKGILPLYLVKTIRGGLKLISVPYAVAGGILADSNEASDALLKKAIHLSREHSASGITLKQYKVRIDGDLKTDESFYNRELPLSPDLDNLWDQFSETNKERIEDTKIDPFSLDFPSDDLKGFYRILYKHHHRRGVPCVSEKWIKDLVNLGIYRIALLKKNGTIFAGTMLKSFKDTVSFPFTSTTGDNTNEILPIYRLYFELIKKHALSGYRIFHSGRIPVNDDTDLFRLGWGGEKHLYYYQYFPNTTCDTEFTEKKGGKRKFFESAWKLLPSPVVKVSGPFIVKQFP